MVGKRVSLVATNDDSFAFIALVKETFQYEPAKYDEFLKIMTDLNAHRIENVSAVAMVKELMKDHQELLRGFSFFIPCEQEITRENNKRRRLQEFAKKLKTCFDDPHVYDSFLDIVQTRNKPEYEVDEEVAALLQGREDLVMEFRSIYGDP